MALGTITNFVSAVLDQHPRIKLPLMRRLIQLCKQLEECGHCAGWARLFLELELKRLAPVPGPAARHSGVYSARGQV